MVSPRTVGDATNMVVLVSAATYATATVGHSAGLWQLKAFGENWAADGFCLSFKETNFHTHLLCFYGSAVFSMLLWALTRNSSRPEIRIVRDSIGSCFLHGLGHAGLWFQGTKDGTATPPMVKGVRGIALIYVFWATFFFGGVPTPFESRGNLVQAFVHTVVLFGVLPPFLAFTYVSTVLFFNITVATLINGLDGQHDIYYALSSMLMTAPVMIAAWAEPLLCDTWLINWGGHILFDYAIPISNLLYLLVASQHPPRKLTDKAA